MEYNSEQLAQVEPDRVPTIGNEVEIDLVVPWPQPAAPINEEVEELVEASWNAVSDAVNDAVNDAERVLRRVDNYEVGQEWEGQRMNSEGDIAPPLNWNIREENNIVNNVPENIEQNVEVRDINEDQIPVVIVNDDSTDFNEHVDDPDQEEIEMAKKKLKLDIKSEEKQVDDEEEDPDLGRLCPICMDYWNNSGEHRLCSLRCGHLFGHSCVLRWLQNCTSSNRRCPQCNKKAAVKDIRVIYATNIQVVDTVELEMLKKQILEVTAEKNRIEMELSKSQLRQRMLEDQITNLSKTIHDLERQKTDMTVKINESIRSVVRKFHLDHTLDICKEGGCRVLDYNKWSGHLAVSQKSANNLFPGYGVKKISTDIFQPMQFVLLHNQAIRDIAFHPVQQSLLLTVSFDKTAKLMDIQNNVVVHGYPVDGQIWSCCWSGDNSNIFHAGTQNGSIVQFDIRQTSGAVDTIESPGDRSPVVSLASVPSNSSAGIIRGGFLATHLNTCYAYEQSNSTYTAKQMFLEGPFISIRYDEKNHHALVSSRPNNRQPQARHVVLSVEKGNGDAVLCNIVHTFAAGNSQKLLSRPCYVHVDDDTLIAAHQESTKTIPIWSIAAGKQIFSLTASDPVLNMVSFSNNSNVFLATLSAKKLRIYNYQHIS
ncbi:E3 ubiquitin-protein ligase RFWD3-like isoform X2 [Chelonus insularis]|uniref:E3 ubiquitin-protein ligase RFWD3-like isoform X2 n=1 Tax=Chelonus insularis TaxID=460826 RepID=UPI0015886F1D|nr:E3 ubiquitin-protein ligase RFWD3-like isoform X2 [Chelonus insularis]